MVDAVPLDHQYVLNYAGKYLSRDAGPARHNYGQLGDPGGTACEAWRFPIIDTFRDPTQPNGLTLDRVTFVFADPGPAPVEVSVIGTFARLYDPIPLQRVTFLGDATKYRAVSVTVPKGQLHRYLFLADRVPIQDPINPQRVVLENGKTWSRFFTALCTQPTVFNRQELVLLDRLTDHILPFRTPDGQRFLQYFYDAADRQAKETQYASAYRLDQPVGVVNFIDKLLAAAENHHLVDYQICLRQIDAILRRRHPGLEPASMPKEDYVDLYGQMAAGQVDGWDYGQYQDPSYFLKLLRRHTYTGAFSHPRYGGNVGAAGWAYLEESYRGPAGESCFDWRKALEAPFGLNADYHG
jgi:Gluconate 2-dehydrogenase subunit 3